MKPLRERRGSFFHRGDWWYVRPRFLLDGDAPASLRASPANAARQVDAWCAEPRLWPSMLALYASLCGSWRLSLAEVDRDTLVKPTLRRALERGQLVALRERVESVAPPQGQPAPSPSASPSRPPPPPKTHSLDVTLVDESGGSLAGRRFRLQLPNGKTEEGLLDGSGRISRADVTEGTAWLWILPETGSPIAAEDIGSS